MLFSLRYKNQINDSDFIQEFEFNLKRKIIDKLYEFDAPCTRQISRYDTWIEDTLTSKEAYKIYILENDSIECSTDDIDEQWLLDRETYVLFDIIELWYASLSGYDQNDLRKDLNDLLKKYETPWVLVDGNFIKIDKNQFNQDLINNALSNMKLIQNEINIFKHALNEFSEALKYYNANEFSKVILFCGKSYESTLKVICEKENGQAKELTKAFIESEYCEDIPGSIAVNGFKDNILMSLPYIRNKTKVAHGSGEEDIEISSSFANLAINLTATLNTFLIEQFKNKMIKNNYEGEDYDDMPF